MKGGWRRRVDTLGLVWWCGAEKRRRRSPLAARLWENRRATRRSSWERRERDRCWLYIFVRRGCSKILNKTTSCEDDDGIVVDWNQEKEKQYELCAYRRENGWSKRERLLAVIKMKENMVPAISIYNDSLLPCQFQSQRKYRCSCHSHADTCLPLAYVYISVPTALLHILDAFTHINWSNILIIMADCLRRLMRWSRIPIPRFAWVWFVTAWHDIDQDGRGRTVVPAMVSRNVPSSA